MGSGRGGAPRAVGRSSCAAGGGRGAGGAGRSAGGGAGTGGRGRPGSPRCARRQPSSRRGRERRRRTESLPGSTGEQELPPARCRGRGVSKPRRRLRVPRRPCLDGCGSRTSRGRRPMRPARNRPGALRRSMRSRLLGRGLRRSPRRRLRSRKRGRPAALSMRCRARPGPSLVAAFRSREGRGRWLWRSRGRGSLAFATPLSVAVVKVLLSVAVVKVLLSVAVVKVLLSVAVVKVKVLRCWRTVREASRAGARSSGAVSSASVFPSAWLGSCRA